MIIITTMELSDRDRQDYLNYMGERVLDEDAQASIRDILKCAVCFEVPKAGMGLKIQTCEQGHHFCPGCYKKLKHCAICRGQFLLGRNFVVEELITQHGPSLGLTKICLPPPDGTSKLTPGRYMCLHSCKALLTTGHMLTHIRKKHEEALLDNVRSNPYLKRFDWVYEIPFILDKLYVFTVNISDMGLFTIVINISEPNLIGSVHMLGDFTVLPSFQYKLTVKVTLPRCSHEFSISDCELFDYNYDSKAINESEKSLKVNVNKLTDLVAESESLRIIFYIWRKKEENKGKGELKLQTLVPSVPVVYGNDRNVRRNRQRNLRKKKQNQKYRVLYDKTDEDLAKIFKAWNLVDSAF